MKSTRKSDRKRGQPIPAESIARLVDQGGDVSRFFSNTGRMMTPGPIRRVNVDLASGMLEELDRAARELNISRQAVIKTLIRQALDQQYRVRGVQVPTRPRAKARGRG
jgi:Ribbon-helix-helix protein, copG family